MQILSLVNPEQYIKYKLNKYPDGQRDITIDPTEVNTSEPISIESRLNNMEDLGLIIATTCALRNIYFDAQQEAQIHLYIPYLLGARSDRKFVSGGISYLKQVIAPMINAQNFATVTVMDVHSDVAEAVIDRLVKVDNIKLVDFALDTIWPEEAETKELCDILRDNTVIISPDAGALKKIYPVAEEFEIENIVIASKHRDIKTGKILSTEVPLHPFHHGKRFVIIDDICDGGRTFIEIAKVIKNTFPDATIYLVVTHGIFSAGFDELREYFNKIFTTNSVKDIPVSENYKAPDFVTNFIHQYNIF